MLGQFLPPKLILRKLLRVDGEGSGLDADLWDGFERDMKPGSIRAEFSEVRLPLKGSITDPPSKTLLCEADLPANFFLLTAWNIALDSINPVQSPSPVFFDLDVDWDAGKIRAYGYNNSANTSFTVSGRVYVNYLASEYSPPSGWNPHSKTFSYTLSDAITLTAAEERTVPIAFVLFPGHFKDANIDSISYSTFEPSGYESSVSLSLSYDNTLHFLYLTMTNNHTSDVTFSGLTIDYTLTWSEPAVPEFYLWMDTNADYSFSLNPGEETTFTRKVTQLAPLSGYIDTYYYAFADVSNRAEIDKIEVTPEFDNSTFTLISHVKNNSTTSQTIWGYNFNAGVIIKNANLNFGTWEGSYAAFDLSAAAHTRTYKTIGVGWNFSAIQFIHVKLHYTTPPVKFAIGHLENDSAFSFHLVNDTDTVSYTHLTLPTICSV